MNPALECLEAGPDRLQRLRMISSRITVPQRNTGQVLGFNIVADEKGRGLKILHK